MAERRAVVNALRVWDHQFHGAAYEFLRQQRLDAATFFDNANGNPETPSSAISSVYRRRPIRKDKMFGLRRL